jgi:hypothetical protein
MLGTPVDLETVNPQGRIDVLAYRGMEKLTKRLEQQYGLVGVWDVLKPHINQAISKGMEGFEVPVEAKILLGILQANYKTDTKTEG